MKFNKEFNKKMIQMNKLIYISYFIVCLINTSCLKKDKLTDTEIKLMRCINDNHLKISENYKKLGEIGLSSDPIVDFYDLYEEIESHIFLGSSKKKYVFALKNKKSDFEQEKLKKYEELFLINGVDPMLENTQLFSLCKGLNNANFSDDHKYQFTFFLNYLYNYNGDINFDGIHLIKLINNIKDSNFDKIVYRAPIVHAYYLYLYQKYRL